MEIGFSDETGEAHSHAVEVIMGWIGERWELTPEDRQKLLAALS